MDEYEAIAFLTDVSYESRTDSIKSLHNILKSNKGKCVFSDCYEISRGLAVVLFDKEIDVRVPGLNFVCDFISCLEENDDNCIQVLIPAILTCLQDSRSGVQLISLKALKMCFKKTKDFQSSLGKIISEGICSQNSKISKIVMAKIHFLMEDYKKDKGLSPLIQALFNQLSNKSMQHYAFEALKKLKNSAGDKIFSSWCADVPENFMKIYQHLTGNVKGSSSIDSLMKNVDSNKAKDIDFDYSDENCETPFEDRQVGHTLKFGFLPTADYNSLIKCINRCENADELERLKRSVESSHFDRSQLHYFSDFVDFLLKFFNASNARACAICLEIIRILVGAFRHKLRSHLKFLMMSIFQYLCSAISPLKEDLMSTTMKMFECISMKDSCSCLLGFFKHSRRKIRQEALNVIVFALSKFPLEEFDMRMMIPPVLDLLLDPKKSVRQAAMECTALLGSLLGPDQCLMDHYLEKIESSPSGSGVTRAVMERLKIRKVPKCRSDGTVEYVAISREAGPLVLEWILLAGTHSEGVGRSISTDGVFLNQLSNQNGLYSSYNGERRGTDMSNSYKEVEAHVNETKARHSTSVGSHSGFEPFLSPIERIGPSSSALGRKYHSAGLVNRMQDDAVGGRETSTFNFDQSCNTPSSLVESISSTASSATCPDPRRMSSAQKNGLRTFPTTRTKFSAGKNVLRMFERLEQREMENKKLLKEEESKIIQSRRCPLKANTDHRLLLNLNFEKDVEPFRNGASFHKGDNMMERSVDNLHDSNNNLRRDSKSSCSTEIQVRPSTPMQKMFPGRSDYPLDLYLNDQSSNRLNVTNNQNNSSNLNSRRISVVQIEMPDAWTNKSATVENKEVPNGFKPSKTTRPRQAMSRKKEQTKENEEKALEEKPLTIDDLIHVLNTDDWKSEVASLEKISEMCQSSPHLITSHLSNLVRAVVNEVSNLRSNVAVAAMKCLSELFKHLGTSADTVLDVVITELLNKTGHMNNFMRQEALNCLYNAIQNASFNKSLNLILAHGSNNKNVLIKNATSQMVLSICEMLGTQGVLCGKNKDLTGKIIVSASQFLTDASQEVRANGRKILLNLKGHDQFDQVIRQFIPHEIIVRTIEPALTRVKDVKGDFEITTPMSAHQNRTNINRSSTLKHSRYHSAGNLCNGSGEDKDIPLPSQTLMLKSKKERHARTDETTLDSILKLIHDLDANDYRERWAGIDALRHLVIIEGKVSAVATHINKIFDKFVPILRDPNFKVTIHALQTLKELLPYLASHMSSVLSMTISTATVNLASNNKEVRDAAGHILDTFNQVMDPTLLLPSFVAATMNANARYKTEMVERVSDLVRQVNPQKHKIISLHVLPLLWHLLSTMTTGGLTSASQTKRATERLVMELKDVLGDGLMSSASMNSKVNSAMKQLLTDMLHGGFNNYDAY